MDKMHKMAEAVFGEKLEVLETYITDEVVPEVPENTNMGVYYMSRSLEMLSQADYFIGFGYYMLNGEYIGCEIEMSAAEGYGIPLVLIRDENMRDEILSDLKKEV